MRSLWSTKQVTENNRGLNGRFFTLHSRLYNALSLGVRNDGGRKWFCADVETQCLVVRSIDAFLDCISSDTARHPLVKESVADIIAALGATLLQENESVLKLASKVAVKIVKVLPSSLIESHVLDLVSPLSSLLSSCRILFVTSSATALNLILSCTSSKREKEMWVVFKETDTIDCIINHIRESIIGTKPAEFFSETVGLLSKILSRWPSSRFCVWNDSKLMEVLASLSLEPILSVKAAVLQLYSAIALCSYGAKKLLDDGQTPLQLMVQCMDGSNPDFLKLAGFKLAQCFAISEQGRLKMMEMDCELLVKAIIDGLGNWSLYSGKISKNQMSMIEASCFVSKIACWPGKHQSYFWKLGIMGVLLKLLLDANHITQLFQQCSSLEEQVATVRDGLGANFFLALRPHLWHILGGLAAYCAEDINPKSVKDEIHLKLLVTCACVGFVDSLRSTRQMCHYAVNEPVSRAVLMMVYSPSKYIASQTRSLLCRILKRSAKEDIKYLLDALNATISGDNNRVLDNLQVINLISLTCYSGLSQYCGYIMKNQGVKILLSFIRWLSRNPVHTKSTGTALHLYDNFNMKICCYECEEDWEGEEMFLLFGLWGLAELIHHRGSMKDDVDGLMKQFDCSEDQIITELQEISISSFASGPRLYASYLLSYFGFYGFPTRLGRRIGDALSGDENTNLMLILSDGMNINVHGIIIKVRCPSLLPCRELQFDEKTSTGLLARKEVRLSAHVNHKALLKLLEYVYSGYLRAGEDLVKKLKTLAKHCHLQPLLQMLSGSRPKWKTPVPSFDLTPALGPTGYHFSDIILEANANIYGHWRCDLCSASQPHIHAHKVILCASCDHMRALLCSGMQESQSETIKIDLGWEALVKLVNWFYSDQLQPKPKYGCLWDNLSAKEKLDEVIPYVELYCLSDIWVLQDLREECSRVIASRLDSAYLAIKIIQVAADRFQWDLVELAANFIAPSYHCLRNSGELDELDEELDDMVRAASVRLSQQVGHRR